MKDKFCDAAVRLLAKERKLEAALIDEAAPDQWADDKARLECVAEFLREEFGGVAAPVQRPGKGAY